MSLPLSLTSLSQIWAKTGREHLLVTREGHGFEVVKGNVADLCVSTFWRLEAQEVTCPCYSDWHSFYSYLALDGL